MVHAHSGDIRRSHARYVIASIRAAGTVQAAQSVILVTMPNVSYRIGVCLLALGVVGCSSGSGKHSSAATTTIPQVPARVVAASPDATRHFADVGYGLSFDYPQGWHEAPYKEIPSTFGAPIVFLSNATLHAPCTHTYPSPGDEQTTCGSPIKTLAPGQFLVTWSTSSNPGSRFQPFHPNTTVGGKPAAVSLVADGGCGQMRGEQTMTAEIAEGQFSHYAMVACMRAPNVTRTETLVRRMLRSVQFDS